MEIFKLISAVFGIVETICSGVMCVYGYKWSRGLIATMSLYIGFAISILVTVPLIGITEDFGMLLLIPIIMVVFWVAAYKNIVLNHFLAGFLLTIKVTFMLLLLYIQNTEVELNIELFLIPILVGIISGAVICSKYNNQILILCTSFIGAAEFVPKIMDYINKASFAVTGDISYIFDPISFLLGLIGIEIPSTTEILLVFIVFLGGYYIQKKTLEAKNIDLKGTIIDDREL